MYLVLDILVACRELSLRREEDRLVEKSMSHQTQDRKELIKAISLEMSIDCTRESSTKLKDPTQRENLGRGEESAAQGLQVENICPEAQFLLETLSKENLVQCNPEGIDKFTRPLQTQLQGLHTLAYRDLRQASM
jgi:hypothetical protein